MAEAITGVIAREVENPVRESDVEIYWVPPARYALWNGPALLSELTEEAGGRHSEVGGSRDLPSVAEKIGRELRHRYVLGYVPPSRRSDGRYRHIRVRLARAHTQPRLTAYWKRGYYAQRSRLQGNSLHRRAAIAWLMNPHTSGPMLNGCICRRAWLGQFALSA
jgi:hypothetical protein